MTSNISRIEIGKRRTEQSATGEKVYLNASSLDDENLINYKLDCYDSVFIESFSTSKPVIFVEGAVVERNGKEIDGGVTLTESNKININFSNGESYDSFIRKYKTILTPVSDTERAYVTRNGQFIPINLNLILYDASYTFGLKLEANDVLTIPFKQSFVSVAGAVNNPGRYPYIPDRSCDYYVGLAGGFNDTKNKNGAVSIVDVNGKEHKPSENILPEYTITAKANSSLYYFNQYAPVITTILSIVSTSLAIAVAAGAI